MSGIAEAFAVIALPFLVIPSKDGIQEPCIPVLPAVQALCSEPSPAARSCLFVHVLL